MRWELGGAIQSDAALRQSIEPRQMAAATLSDGALLAILQAAPEIRVPFRVDNHHGSELGGKSQGGHRDRNQPCHEKSAVRASLWIAPGKRGEVGLIECRAVMRTSRNSPTRLL